jgi:hypothetical protein
MFHAPKYSIQLQFGCLPASVPGRILLFRRYFLLFCTFGLLLSSELSASVTLVDRPKSGKACPKTLTDPWLCMILVQRCCTKARLDPRDSGAPADWRRQHPNICRRSEGGCGLPHRSPPWSRDEGWWWMDLHAERMDNRVAWSVWKLSLHHPRRCWPVFYTRSTTVRAVWIQAIPW